MGVFGIVTGQDNIHFGNRGDACILCVREKSQKEKISITDATNQLKGTLEGKKLLKFTVSGSPVIICMDHIHKLSDDNKEGASDNAE